MDTEEFAHVYDEYHEMVLHLVFDLLQDYELSQYICLEVFAEFYGKMKRMDESRVKGWPLRKGKKKAKSLKRGPRQKRKLKAAAEKIEKEFGIEYLSKSEERRK